MKRFTQTDKWKDPWYRELSPIAKLAFQYLCDNCDNAGVWDPDYRLASFCMKADVDWDDILDGLGSRVVRLQSGKIWLTRFIAFQCFGPNCTELNPNSHPHRFILDLLKKHKIPLADVYRDRSDQDAAAVPPAPDLPGLRNPPAGARDLAFEALAEIQGIDLSRLTPSSRGRLNKALAEIRAAEPGVTPERIHLAAKAWKKKGYSAPATAATLASHWSELTPAPETEGDREEKGRRKQDLASARVELKGLTRIVDSGQAVPRDDLSQGQIDRIKILKALIEELERKDR